MDSSISIVTPLYNKEDYIASTIRSVQLQSLEQWELLVVDNGSSDGGPELVRKFSQSDDRVKFLHSPSKGVCRARNIGVAAASGSWVLFLDADDLLDRDHLKVLLQEASAPIVATGWREFRGIPEQGVTATHDTPADADELQYSSIAFPPWQSAAALISKSVLTGDYLWPEELEHFISEDTAFWFRLIQRHVPRTVSGHTLWYRADSANSRDDRLNLRRWLSSLDAVYRNNIDYLSRQGLPLHWRHCVSLMRSYSSLGRRAQRAGDEVTSSASFERADAWCSQAIREGAWRSGPTLLRWLLGSRGTVEFQTRLGR